jgi:hypothetical protein
MVFSNELSELLSRFIDILKAFGKYFKSTFPAKDSQIQYIKSILIASNTNTNVADPISVWKENVALMAVDGVAA